MYTRQGDNSLTGRYRTAWGNGTVTVARGRLAAIELPPAGDVANADQAGLNRGGNTTEERDLLDRWVAALEDYFKGARLSWTAEEVGLGEMGLNEFERAVYAALLSVPPAVTVSYGVLAEMAGYPRAARAVGNAMAANPLPIAIPCHRVIRADGSLGNYGSDPAWKERLLEHERLHGGGGG